MCNLDRGHCQLALGQEEAKNADKEEQCEASVDEDLTTLNPRP